MITLASYVLCGVALDCVMCGHNETESDGLDPKEWRAERLATALIWPICCVGMVGFAISKCLKK